MGTEVLFGAGYPVEVCKIPNRGVEPSSATFPFSKRPFLPEWSKKFASFHLTKPKQATSTYLFSFSYQ